MLFLLWGKFLQTFIYTSLHENPCFLTETEFKRQNHHFRHLSVQRLFNVLKSSGHDDVDKPTLDRITKICYHCQKHKGPPSCFQFTLKHDSLDFNHSILVDVMYIGGSPVFHVVDEATRFQAVKLMQNISANHTWDAIGACWIDVYIGPPDYIVAVSGTNIVVKEFLQNATAMEISVKNISVDAHWSIGAVKRYHTILRQAYEIIDGELKSADVNIEFLLQMAVKTVNDIAGPDGLGPTLLVFSAYPRTVQSDPQMPTVLQRAAAIR